MEIPFTARLGKGFGTGHSLVIRGKPNHAEAWFAITFLDGVDMLENKYDYPKATAAFQIQPRLNERLVVMNTALNGAWGREERKPGFPIKLDNNNEIKIVCTNNSYEVFFNGTYFANYMHRVNKDSVTHFNFYGDFKIHEIIYN